MIKIEVENRDKMDVLVLSSNNIESDRDTLDMIGNLILSKEEKLGRYTSAGRQEILIKKV